AALLSQRASAGTLPLTWVRQTVEAAQRLMAGRAAPGTVAARAAALAEGVVRTMYLARIKAAIAILLFVTAVAGGVGLATHPIGAMEPQAAPEPGAARPGAGSAIADQMLQKLREEWQRVQQREQAGNPWMDKVTFDSAYEELTKELR